MNVLRRIALANIAVAVAVLALKALAAWLTGSVALFSDALESVVNAATAVVALVAVLYSARPADSNHPYGHQKIEYFSALIEALLIGAAAFAILSQAWHALLGGRAVFASAEGLLLNGAAGVLNGLWCRVLLKRGRAMRSPALVADGRHLFTDVVTSAGVIGGIVLARVTGIWQLDPLLALLVAGNIVWSGWQLLRESLGGLMDMAPPAEELETIRTTIAEAGEGAIQAHDLTARQAGAVTFIEFHLIVPGETTVEASHAICDRIETRLRRDFSGARIIIHVEPEEKAKDDAIVM